MVNKIKYWFKKEYRLVQYRNPLTEEIYFYIEVKGLFLWREWKIENPVYQEKFGCDKDGMFGLQKSAVAVLKFLNGVSKVERKVIEKIEYE